MEVDVTAFVILLHVCVILLDTLPTALLIVVETDVAAEFTEVETVLLASCLAMRSSSRKK